MSKIREGIWQNSSGEQIEVMYPVIAVREFYMLGDDIWTAEGVRDGRKADFLVTQNSLDKAGYALIVGKDD